MVRRPGRRGDEVLCLSLQEFEDHQRHSVLRRIAWAGGKSDDGGVRARRTGVRRAQRWPPVSLHGGTLTAYQLRDAAGSGRAVGEAFRRWRKRTMRVAE